MKPLRRFYYGSPWRWTWFLSRYVLRVGQGDRFARLYNWRKAVEL